MKVVDTICEELVVQMENKKRVNEINFGQNRGSIVKEHSRDDERREIQ
jgi:hypothetical protein